MIPLWPVSARKRGTGASTGFIHAFSWLFWTSVSPADEPPRIGVDDEGDIDEAGPGRDIGKIGQPKPIRRRGVELSVHMIQRTGGDLVADRCPQRLAPDRPLKAHVPHQPGDRAACDREAFPPQLPPDLAHAIGRGSSPRTRAGSRLSDPRRGGPCWAGEKDR